MSIGGNWYAWKLTVLEFMMFSNRVSSFWQGS